MTDSMAYYCYGMADTTASLDCTIASLVPSSIRLLTSMAISSGDESKGLQEVNFVTKSKHGGAPTQNLVEWRSSGVSSNNSSRGSGGGGREAGRSVVVGRWVGK